MLYVEFGMSMVITVCVGPTWVTVQKQVPLDFSKRVFAVDNGSGGKMPTLLDEWKSVGIREASNVMNNKYKRMDDINKCMMKT